VHQTYNNYGGQQNIATDNGTINATLINNNADIEQLATKLAELLKSSQLPAELKEEAVDLAETVAEQAKAGQPKKGILKTFGDKIKLVKDTVTGTDAALHASQDLYNTANQLGELIRQSIS
jgi:lipid A disaccharide synthetase